MDDMDYLPRWSFVPGGTYATWAGAHRHIQCDIDNQDGQHIVQRATVVVFQILEYS